MTEWDGKPDTSGATNDGATPEELREPIATEAQNPPEIAIPAIEPDVPPIVNVEPSIASAAPPAAHREDPRRPRTLFLARLVQALWVGGGVFAAMSAVAVFRVLAPSDAANAVGAMLTRWHYIALMAPAVLILVEWRRMRSKMVMLLFAAVIFAVMQGFVDLRIRRVRAASPIPISSLDRDDPVRRHFGALHGFSSLLLLAQIVAGMAVIAAEPDRE